MTETEQIELRLKLLDRLMALYINGRPDLEKHVDEVIKRIAGDLGVTTEKK